MSKNVKKLSSIYKFHSVPYFFLTVQKNFHMYINTGNWNKYTGTTSDSTDTRPNWTINLLPCRNWKRSWLIFIYGELSPFSLHELFYCLNTYFLFFFVKSENLKPSTSFILCGLKMYKITARFNNTYYTAGFSFEINTTCGQWKPTMVCVFDIHTIFPSFLYETNDSGRWHFEEASAYCLLNICC